MLEFRELRLEDREAAEKIFFSLPYRLCDYSYSDLYIWRKVYQTRIAWEGGRVFFKFLWSNTPHYLVPVGAGSLKDALLLLQEDARKEGHPMLLSCVTPELKAELEAAFPGRFAYEPTRDTFDYVYNAQQLVTLAGRKLHSKRNHVTRFQQLGEWGYEPIDAANIAECHAMSDDWCKKYGCGMDASLRSEHCAVEQAFAHFFELGLLGGLIRQNGKVVAFSFGKRLCKDTFLTSIEKAYAEIEGAYAVINQEFAAHNAAEFAYVNREDDAGDEGLRKAKLSYHPEILLEKDIASIPGGAL